MKPTISYLKNEDKPNILEHFTTLGATSIRMRFGSPMTLGALENYVNQLDCERDVLLGIYQNNTLVAFMHIAMVSAKDGVVEIGLSVLESSRRQGLAALLLREGKDLAFYRKWNRLEMLHVSENTAISKLCKKEKLFIIRDGCEYLGVWETAHSYQTSLDQEAPYVMLAFEEMQ